MDHESEAGMNLENGRRRQVFSKLNFTGTRCEWRPELSIFLHELARIFTNCWPIKIYQRSAVSRFGFVLISDNSCKKSKAQATPEITLESRPRKEYSPRYYLPVAMKTTFRLPVSTFIFLLVSAFVLAAHADTYPRQPGVEPINYAFRIELSDGDE